jgi:hypothetical protein
MTQIKPSCPSCGQFNTVFKASLVYLQATERLTRRDDMRQPELDRLLQDLKPLHPSESEQERLRMLTRVLAPPQGRQKISRRVHPDLMVVFFGSLAVMLLFQMAIEQGEALPVAILLFGASLIGYAIARKSIVNKFDATTRLEVDEKQAVEKAIDLWMRLYICSRDEGGFIPGGKQLVPLDQLSVFLRDP